jgi:flagellar basal-body rod protein FlgF
MDNTLYVALSRQMILRRQMDVVANNIANTDTAAFKVEDIITETSPERLPVQPGSGSKNVQFVLDTGLARDFAQGALTSTSSPLDIAIEGDAFFQINTVRGERFTRDGRFATDQTGRLVTKTGEPVAGDGGAEIILDPLLGEPSIARDGTISQDGQRVGKLAAYRFASVAGLAKDGDGLYRNEGNQAPEVATDVQLHQRTIENSNVKPVIEVTRLIEVSREYERIARLMDQTAELDRKAIERLGRVS